MKEIKNIIIRYTTIILLVVFVGACDFLEVDPIGRTSIPVLFSDVDGIRAALPGTYSTFYDYYEDEFFKYPEVAGNMLRLTSVGSGANMLSQYNFTSDPGEETATVGYIWRFIYEALANTNNIIKYQPGLLAEFPGQKDELNRIMAEALFLRALGHFDLCRVYAQPYNYTDDASHLGVPIVLKVASADDNLPRNTVKEVYEQIIKDIENSLEYFEGLTPREDFYASPDADNALLARVYLYMEDWDKVIEYATKVIDRIPLSYGDDYLDMYNNLEAGDENIFRLNGTLKSSALKTFYLPLSPIAVPADTLIGLFDNLNDIRLQLLTQDDGSPVCKKYHVTADVAEEDEHYDPFVLRCSEMYLNRAEAYLNKNMLSEAAADVKAIIARGLQIDVSEVELSLTYEELALAIEQERAKELCFEGHQFFDITRWKKDLVRSASTNSSVKRIAYPSDLFVLPIPQKEMDTNPNMVQNPSYN